jgi:hypothetical protein
MTPEELRRAVKEPARSNGWVFELGLVDLLLRDVADEPGALPLLSHVLLETWQRRRGRTLTLGGYLEAGGVHGAIAQTAEVVYRRLDERQQAIAHNIFLRLIEPGEDAPDTRRRAALDELVPCPEEAPAVEAVLDVLANARLITTEKENVQLAHEALIREWPTLQEWLEEDQSFRMWQRRLWAALRQWEASGRDTGALLRGTPLAEAEQWLVEQENRLSQPEKAFIRAGVARRDQLRRQIMSFGFLPFVILTLCMSAVGAFIVTRLVASSLDERLTNQLYEASRVIEDDIGRKETEQLEAAQIIACTVGLAEALNDGDRSRVVTLAQPAALVHPVESLAVVDAVGRTMMDLLLQDDGSYRSIEEQLDISELRMVRPLLGPGAQDGMPNHGLASHPVNQRYYYFSAIPVELEEEVVGAVIVGTSLDTLLSYFKETALADVVIYLDGGRAVATTFAFAEQPGDVKSLLDELSTTPSLYQSALHGTDSATGEDIEVRGRPYRLVRWPFRVGNDSLGVFAAALPLEYVVEGYTIGRNVYTLIFALAALLQGAAGYLVARFLVRIVLQPAQVSKALPRRKRSLKMQE